MKNYRIQYKYSKTGTSWTQQTETVKATSDEGAIEQIKSKGYPYIKDIKILSIS